MYIKIVFYKDLSTLIRIDQILNMMKEEYLVVPIHSSLHTIGWNLSDRMPQNSTTRTLTSGTPSLFLSSDHLHVPPLL